MNKKEKEKVGELILVRGLPGSGKSTFVKNIETFLVDSLVYMIDEDYYYEKPFYSKSTDECWSYDYVTDKRGFDPNELFKAHKRCLNLVKSVLKSKLHTFVMVHNTFCTEKEIEPYRELAEKYNYNFTTIIVENRHGSKSVHNVPDETIEKMKNKFSVKL